MSVWANTRGVPGQAAGADVAMGPGAVFIVYGPARQHKLLPTCEQISSFLHISRAYQLLRLVFPRRLEALNSSSPTDQTIYAPRSTNTACGGGPGAAGSTIRRNLRREWRTARQVLGSVPSVDDPHACES